MVIPFPVPHSVYIFDQIIELQMCALSNRIREKPDWWEKIKDETIVGKWREEALEQGKDEDNPEWSLAPEMVNFLPFLELLQPL